MQFASTDTYARAGYGMTKDSPESQETVDITGVVFKSLVSSVLYCLIKISVLLKHVWVCVCVCVCVCVRVCVCVCACLDYVTVYYLSV